MSNSVTPPPGTASTTRNLTEQWEQIIHTANGFQMLLLLLSLNAVTHRPEYLRTTALGCAALSFTINTVSLCSLFVLVLMAYVLTLDPPSRAPLKKARVCTGVVGVSSVLICLVLAGIRGPKTDLLKEIPCFMDSDGAMVTYPAAKLCLTFVIPFSFILVLLVCGCVRQKKSNGRFLSGLEEGPVFLVVTVVVLVCHLFYGISLVRDSRQTQEPVHRRSVFLSVAEFVLFMGSSVSLLLVLVMHRPCRESLFGIFSQLKDCCRSPVRTQTTRNIITPHIEITDTLQDIES
ncbi:uncharacterized protein LOC128758629 isoform X2 [Synchiropus splendidus]|uniref:uncharacterized protein LOC128758629 isoform X2 n=1 Tax=Synchiropus splendidus TaxID=270530 RepID=UPI00237DD688|nr:uncharacterized protein LOC128758629 isoform X2 [Synchiropus splendidus]